MILNNYLKSSLSKQDWFETCLKIEIGKTLLTLLEVEGVNNNFFQNFKKKIFIVSGGLKCEKLANNSCKGQKADASKWRQMLYGPGGGWCYRRT